MDVLSGEKAGWDRSSPCASSSLYLFSSLSFILCPLPALHYSYVCNMACKDMLLCRHVGMVGTLAGQQTGCTCATTA